MLKRFLQFSAVLVTALVPATVLAQPAVAFTQPAANATVTNPNVLVKWTACSSSSISSAVTSVNGAGCRTP